MLSAVLQYACCMLHACSSNSTIGVWALHCMPCVILARVGVWVSRACCAGVGLCWGIWWFLLPCARVTCGQVPFVFACALSALCPVHGDHLEAPCQLFPSTSCTPDALNEPVGYTRLSDHDHACTHFAAKSRNTRASLQPAVSPVHCTQIILAVAIHGRRPAIPADCPPSLHVLISSCWCVCELCVPLVAGIPGTVSNSLLDLVHDPTRACTDACVCLWRMHDQLRAPIFKPSRQEEHSPLCDSLDSTCRALL